MRTRDPRVLLVVLTALLVAITAFPLGVIASHRFSDVPASSSFHSDIAAVSAVGLTTGCAAGKFCPKDFVTREQMAAFLNRIGALSEGSEPVVNADRLDGLDAAALSVVAGTSEGGSFLVPKSPTWGEYIGLDIVAPMDGYVVVNASVTIYSHNCSTGCVVYGRLFGTSQVGVRQQMYVPTPSYAVMSLTAVIPVVEGSNHVAVQLSDPYTDTFFVGYWGQMTAQFSPFGSVVPTRSSHEAKSE